MIKDLLPRYYEAHNKVDTKYLIVSSSMIDGHEVAWVEFSGTVAWNGEKYKGRLLYCECDFTEGVGWRIDPVHGVVSTTANSRKCANRMAYVRQRHAELCKEFTGRFGRPVCNHIEEVILALIEKIKAGEFIEDGTEIVQYGQVEIWACYLSLQTVASIVNNFNRSFKGLELPEVAFRMEKEKKIALEGYIVRPIYK